ncbi:hypothetical protein CspeluHIS016_0202420 [Cutaneotrichosporon spelunceum]|uniref:Uncharacterized protein n=1 Tax=Cutaneotrichosporon spelunceum TaxID=1672016 RepID=A0AAD3TRI1_9TREE|nr:hypothetical protein CspeluHIS016_0202420 [Cutaneotrichosporon spelunceum]
MVVHSTSTYISEKQKLLALPARKGRARRLQRLLDVPPPYSPVARRNERTLYDDDDTVSTWSTESTCGTPSTPSPIGTLLSTTTNGASSTTTMNVSTLPGFESTSSYTTYDQGFATFVTLTTRVVPITSLPPAYARCLACSDGYSAAQLGLSCPYNCLPASTL